MRTTSAAAGLCLCSVVAAHAATTPWVGDQRGDVRLITASDSIDGTSLRAGLEFRYPQGWHGYWRTPGDAGIAPRLDWATSDNVGTASVQWPAPARLVVEGLQNSVYTGRFVLPLDLQIKDPHRPTRVSVSVDYAACANICVPKHADLSLDLMPGTGDMSPEAILIAAAQAAVPQTPAAAGIEVTHQAIEGKGAARQLVVTLRSSSDAFQHPDLFVEGGDGLPPAPAVQLGDGGLTATLTSPLPESLATRAPLTLTVVDGARAAEFSGPAFAGATAALPSVPQDGKTLPAILLVALLGGLILNLMPCVLPILSIKLFGLTRHAGGDQREARLGAVATALGILTSFAVLALVLIGLKLSGAALGWGIQFQQPWFLAGMAVVTALFAASFFEWLPITLPQRIAQLGGGTNRGPQVEAFFSGVFSTLLATPCSAPFVGTAVGFALAQGPFEIFAVFCCLGLGMALPFLAVAIAPRLVTWLPRPGHWMNRLRQIMGLLLLGTTVWLLVVLSNVAGEAIAISVGVLLAALLSLRAFVSAQSWASERRWPNVATAALAATAFVIVSIPGGGVAGKSGAAEGWQAFDPQAIDRLVGEGKTVLVDVTASWCLTCKVNELTAFENADVKNRLAQTGIVRMRADWSRPDPQIAAYLQRFGRFGIPLDAVYGPRRPDGQPLPEILTPASVLHALDDAGGTPSLKSADNHS